jgi:DNA-binding MarR family transcriptional regulator
MTPMSAEHPDGDPELTNSDRWVYHVIAEREPVTRQALLRDDRVDVAERTLDRALSRLEDRGYVVLLRESGDLRQIVAILASSPTSNSRQR